jgi:phage tail sheath gpL-like
MALIVGIPNEIIVHDVRNTNDYLPITDATVTVEVKDSLGDLVAGEFWPVTLEYSVINYQGAYRANLSPSLALVAGESYNVIISAVDDDGNPFISDCLVIAEAPGCGC